MRLRNMVAVMLLTVIPVFCYAGEIVKNLTLEMGEEKIVSVSDIKGVSNSGDIVEDIVLEDGNSVLIRAKSWGKTQITIWKETGEQIVYMISVNLPEYVKELEGYLDDIEGADLKLLGKNLVVAGELLRASDIQRLSGILENFPQIKNMVDTSLNNKRDVLLSAVKSEINNPDLKYSIVGNGLMIEGEVYSESEKRRVENIGALYFREIYPVLTIKNVEITLNVAVCMVKNDTLNTKQTGDLRDFIASASDNNSTQLPVYTFLKEESHAQRIQTIMDRTGARVIFRKKYTVADNKQEIVRFSDDKGDVRFYIELTPSMLQKNALALETNISLEDGVTNMFWRTGTYALTSGQGVLIADVNQAIAQSLNDKNKDKVRRIAMLDSFMSTPGSIMLVLISPVCAVKE